MVHSHDGCRRCDARAPSVFHSIEETDGMNGCRKHRILSFGVGVGGETGTEDIAEGGLTRREEELAKMSMNSMNSTNLKRTRMNQPGGRKGGCR